MLIHIDSGREITYIPHAGDWNTWRGRLTQEQWQAVRDELNTRITSGEVHTAGWMPGADWNGTSFQPLYDVACRGNAEAAALRTMLTWAVASGFVPVQPRQTKSGAVPYDTVSQTWSRAAGPDTLTAYAYVNRRGEMPYLLSDVSIHVAAK